MTPEALMEPEAMEHLAGLAAAVPSDQCVVEVGTYQAANLVSMALASKQGNKAKVYGVDPYGQGDIYHGRPHMLERYTQRDYTIARKWITTNKCGRIARIIIGTSATVAPDWDKPPVGLLVIDGEHRTDALHADLAHWLPRLAPDALIAFDDYGGPVGRDVKKYVDTLVDRGTLELVQVIGQRLAICKHN